MVNRDTRGSRDRFVFMLFHGLAHSTEVPSGAALAITFIGRGLGGLMTRADSRFSRGVGGVLTVAWGYLAAA